MDAVVPVLVGYAIGSLPLGYVVAQRTRGVDLRRVGSGNVGAANALRSAGLLPGILVVLVDVAKGASGVLFAARLAGGPGDPVAAGVAAIVGHVFPVWLRFHGGKGVATACGVFWMLAPLATGLAATLFVATVCATRYVSLGSVLATTALPPLAWLTGASLPTLMGASLSAALIVGRHRANLFRLHRGNEPRLSRGRGPGDASRAS